VFSASLPSASVAAAGAALDIVKNEPERRRRLLRVANLLREELRARGFNVYAGETAIVPVVIQNELDLCRLCKALLEEGIYINPVLRPAAAQNLLRISCTAAHTEKHVDKLVTTLVRLTEKLGIER
jgi:8-amino-7-oxononanoate synthase